MADTYERHIRLEGAHNVRDLGGYATLSGGSTRWRSFLRADALHGLTEADVETLVGLGVRTVIDLRTDAEIAAQPSRLANDDRISYHHISLFGALAPVDAMMAQGGGFDMSARYIAAVDGCRPALTAVARTIAEADEGVILFNCTAGKDRTGIIAAMLLSLAGVSTDEIAADYALTGTIAGALIAKLRENARARGLDDATSARILASDPAAMLAFLSHVEGRHGGFRSYLAGEGHLLASIERRLLQA